MLFNKSACLLHCMAFFIFPFFIRSECPFLAKLSQSEKNLVVVVVTPQLVIQQSETSLPLETEEVSVIDQVDEDDSQQDSFSPEYISFPYKNNSTFLPIEQRIYNAVRSFCKALSSVEKHKIVSRFASRTALNCLEPEVNNGIVSYPLASIFELYLALFAYEAALNGHNSKWQEHVAASFIKLFQDQMPELEQAVAKYESVLKGDFIRSVEEGNQFKEADFAAVIKNDLVAIFNLVTRRLDLAIQDASPRSVIASFVPFLVVAHEMNLFNKLVSVDPTHSII